MSDVTAYYPSLQLRYKFGYRNMANPENFEKIHGENLRFKASGNKTARLPYKIADNAISGQLKDPNSSLWDPRENNAVCVNGQLLLVDLLEKLESYIELIQSNTDGILFKMPSKYKSFEEWHGIIDDIVWEWEERTGMRMEFSIYKKVFQKDVNNYLLVGADGKTKTKGAYTKSLSVIDNDLPIINKALVDYMTKKIPIEKTINDCNDLKMFQKVVKLSGKYWRAWHNNKFMTEKCYRVFASTHPNDTYMGKCKVKGATIEKFGNTPNKCFIDNTNVNNKFVPSYLDKSWYIDLANKRLTQYGVGVR
jgi:DNA polymerase